MLSSRKSIILGALIGLMVIVLIGSQNALVRNAYYAWNFERSLDRYDQSDQTENGLTNSTHLDGRTASLLSAFFGLDDGLPILANLVICDGASGQDGMPIIFSSEIDISTLEPGDLRIVQGSGRSGEIRCLTMAPADDTGEFRTALLVGQFGDLEDPPIRVEVTGNVHSKDGTTNFQGTSVDVTPLLDGPSLVWAEIVPDSQWQFGAKATGIPFGGGGGCPTGTKQVVRVTWSGGVTKPNGQPADDLERLLYNVAVRDETGRNNYVTPIELADLGDGDNNHKLCLDTDATAIAVSFPAGRLTDPRGDLNPATSIAIWIGR